MADSNFDGYAVGIDLGSTYSRVAIWKGDHAETIVDDQGLRCIPSYVGFHGEDIVVGEEARNLLARNASNTVFEAKQFIGRSYHDPRVLGDLARWPFKVVEDALGKPVVEVRFEGVVRTFTAEEIMSYIIRELKDAAENFLNDEVTCAVVTVPATFTHFQRLDTLRAAERAGLCVLRLLNAVDAAALAYCAKVGPSDQERTVAFFDFGGGSLDVALAVIEGGVCEIKAVVGDSHLGGVHFDQILVGHCAQIVQQRHSIDLQDGQPEHTRPLRRLYAACERAKRSLSKYHQAYIDLDSLLPGYDFHLVLERSQLNTLFMPLYARAVHLFERVLHDAKVFPADVHDLVLVGGSSRIPKLKEMLFETLGGRPPNHSLDTDECIVHGAAFSAAYLSGQGTIKAPLSDILLLDVVPLSLSVEIVGGGVVKVVKRNTTLPAKKSVTLATSEDHQASATLHIYQGEHARAEDNQFLGSFTMGPLPNGPKGSVTVEVTFDLDSNGNLTVTGWERGTQLEGRLRIDEAVHPRPPSTDGLMDLASGYAHKHPLDDPIERELERELDGV